MFKLYGTAGSGSAAVEALLEEIGAPYEIENPRDENKVFRESFAKVNPMKQVPALVLPDGTVMTESGAMLVYLADHFSKAGLAPELKDPRRPDYLRWMFFLAANVYMTDLHVYYTERYAGGEAGVPAVKEAAEKRMAAEWLVYANALGDKPFILGETMSAVDIYAALLSTWNPNPEAFFARHPNVKKMYDRVSARPAIARVWARHGM